MTHFPLYGKVWVCPGQFSVPIQLPLQLLGFPSNATRPISALSTSFLERFRASLHRMLAQKKQCLFGLFPEAIVDYQQNH